jgi:hypothetical protein
MKRLFAAAALLLLGAASALSQTAFSTPDGRNAAQSAVIMCLNGSSQAVPCSSTFPLSTSSATVTQGFRSSVTLTRTADVNAYLASDVVGASVGASAALTFSTVGPSAGTIVIRSVELEIDDTAIISGETSYSLYLYSVTPPSALVDNAPFDFAVADRASFVGKINLGTPVDEGSTLYVRTDNLSVQLRLASTSLFAYLVTAGAYTPTSARVYKITLHAQGL